MGCFTRLWQLVWGQGATTWRRGRAARIRKSPLSPLAIGAATGPSASGGRGGRKDGGAPVVAAPLRGRSFVTISGHILTPAPVTRDAAVIAGRARPERLASADASFIPNTLLNPSVVGVSLNTTGSTAREGHDAPIGAAGAVGGNGGLAIGVRGVEWFVPFADALAESLKAARRVGITAHQGASQPVDGFGIVVTGAGRRGPVLASALAGCGRGAVGRHAGGGAIHVLLARAGGRVVGVVKAATVAKDVVLADVLEVAVVLDELVGTRRLSFQGERSVSVLVRGRTTSGW